MKTGRNQPCNCGSGKKYKKCCIDKSEPLARPAMMRGIPPEVMQQAQEMMRLHKAQENVRQQQQGQGNPIISFIQKGYRFVAVNKTLHWSQNWLVFPDFLLDFIKKTFGAEFGTNEKNKAEHPIFRWLAKFQSHSDSLPTEGKLKTGSMMGFFACWLHLAYALYLIAHNDQLPPVLLTRLRNSVTFMPAYYEAIVGAALAVAGFELSCAEIKATSEPTPEFRIKSKKSGISYEVEAKRKDGWTASTKDVSDAACQKELRSWVRDQVYESSKKKLKNPIYWFELSIPTLVTEADWRIIAAKVTTTLREAEKDMKVGGEPIQSAFVVITNHTFLANEDIEGEPSFAFLETIKIDDYPFGRPVEFEDALEGYDKYRDIFWMMEAWKVARTVPVTFDGTPPELLSPDGVPQPTIKIGDIMEAPGSDGKLVKAKVTEIASMRGEAMVAVTANGKSWLVKMPLTEGETRATQRFTDAIFGKDNASRGLDGDDWFGFYDFMLRAQAHMTQVQVDKFFESNPTLKHYKDLPLKDARVRIAREHTKWMWIRAQQEKKTPAPNQT